MPESLVERELFGHERGAFTGAESSSPGLLERAGRGTVFFDEIGEAPPSIQAKLLRVLDGGEYRPVGGGGVRTLHARVVSATNRDLTDQIQNGHFRADLFYRLAVLPIEMPALRERLEDVPMLWDHHLRRVAPDIHSALDSNSPLGRALLAHDWPGNVRELRNAVEHAARLAGGGPIHPEHLPPSVRNRTAPANGSNEFRSAVERWTRQRLPRTEGECENLYTCLIEEVEEVLLREVKTWASGNQAKMARLLGMHRSTLRQKLRRLDLEELEDDSN